MNKVWGVWLALGFGIFNPVKAQECYERMVYTGDESQTIT